MGRSTAGALPLRYGRSTSVCTCVDVPSFPTVTGRDSGCVLVRCCRPPVTLTCWYLFSCSQSRVFSLLSCGGLFRLVLDSACQDSFKVDSPLRTPNVCSTFRSHKLLSRPFVVSSPRVDGRLVSRQQNLSLRDQKDPVEPSEITLNHVNGKRRTPGKKRCFSFSRLH